MKEINNFLLTLGIIILFIEVIVIINYWSFIIGHPPIQL